MEARGKTLPVNHRVRMALPKAAARPLPPESKTPPFAPRSDN
jgi:hypothetical protein